MTGAKQNTFIDEQKTLSMSARAAFTFQQVLDVVPAKQAYLVVIIDHTDLSHLLRHCPTVAKKRRKELAACALAVHLVERSARWEAIELKAEYARM
jgi:hypothetical protein